MQHVGSRQIAACGFIGLALFLWGCGQRPTGSTVDGTVNLDGASLDTGLIEFRTPDGAGIVADAMIVDGKYYVPGTARLRPGDYRVTIRSSRLTGRKIPVGSPFPPGTMTDEVAERIPAHYNDKSTLEAVVGDGVNTLNFDLVTEVESDRRPR